MAVRRPQPDDGEHHGLDRLYDAAGQREGEQRFLILLGVVGLALALVIAAFFLGPGLSLVQRGSSEPPSGPGTSGNGTATGSSAGSTADSLAEAARGLPVTAPGRRPTARPDRRDDAARGRLPGGLYQGPLAPAPVANAAATCRAPADTGGQGEAVRFGAGQTVDADPDTAWRCVGDGRGEVLTFRLGGRQQLGAVGLIPGYARTDLDDGDSYRQHRRVRVVRWEFTRGRWIEQRLRTSPTSRGLQMMRIPPVQTRMVRLLIRRSVPGTARDVVAISTVRIARTRG